MAARLIDLSMREAWPYLLEMSFQSFMFILELGVDVIMPIIILANAKNRRSIKHLFIGSALVIFGVFLNRINVFVVAYRPPFAQHIYIPSPIEIMVTAGLISALVLVYRLLVINFPVISVPAVDFGRDVAQPAGAVPANMGSENEGRFYK